MDAGIGASELFAAAPAAMSIIDATGRQVHANADFLELFRLDREGLLNAEQLTHPDDRELTRVYLEELRNGERTEVIVDKRYLRADGESFWGRLTARRLGTASDGSALLIGQIQDISSQRELEERLTAAVASKTEFVAKVSHELRNSLHTVSGLAELLAASDLDSNQQRQATTIQRETSGLSRLVGDLIDLGRAEAGHLSISIAPFALRAAIDRAIRLSRPTAEAKGLVLEAVVADGVPRRVDGDDQRLGQILDNLIGNAIKFTETGEVRLAVDQVGASQVRFVISDTGIGIPQDKLDEIFEPFGRVDSSAAGAGLGLTISCRLAEAMGGHITAHSQPGQGAEFQVVVELRTVDVADDQHGAELVDDRDRSHSRILVVEDSPENQLLAAGQLTRLGYQHDLAEDGFKALDLFARETYAAILMDWHLPGIDGLETTRRMRLIERSEEIPRTPIIALTARATAADVEACLAAGADEFLAKPASLAAIGSVLDIWTDPGAASSHLAVESAPAGSHRTVDSDVLEQLSGDLGDPELLASLVATFLRELPLRIAAIRSANGEDHQAVERAAHTLRSTSAMLGATLLGALAGDLEQAAKKCMSIPNDGLEQLEIAAADTAKELQSMVELPQEDRS